MSPLEEAEIELGLELDELAGTFPASIRSLIETSEEEAYDLCNDEFTTETLQRFFSVEAFWAPYCIVRRKYDGQRGTLMFEHSPRYYFGWAPTDL